MKIIYENCGVKNDAMIFFRIIRSHIVWLRKKLVNVCELSKLAMF